uniref:Uncharacterized protein n=1 Tax=Setaria digitata TaxID=48799 RepID=A0A915Q2E6_9BILA
MPLHFPFNLVVSVGARWLVPVEEDLESESSGLFASWLGHEENSKDWLRRRFEKLVEKMIQEMDQKRKARKMDCFCYAEHFTDKEMSVQNGDLSPSLLLRFPAFRARNDPENFAEQDLSLREQQLQAQVNKAELNKQRLVEYRTILRSVRSLRTAENKKNRTKRRVLKQKCEKYKQQIVDEKRLNAVMQGHLFQLERQLSDSTSQLTQLQAEKEQEQRKMNRLKRTLEQSKEVLFEINERNTKKNHIWSLTAKNALHAKRVAEVKLREIEEKYAMEYERSNELEKSTKMLKSAVERLKLELEQKERLCTDSKVRLAMHSETAALAYRQVNEAKKKTAEITEENRNLCMQFENTQSELLGLKETHNELEKEMSRIKLENEKHVEELQHMKQVVEAEVLSLIRNVQNNNVILEQKANLINSLTNENTAIKKEIQKLKEGNKNMEEILHNTEAVLQAQHQELQVYEANQKIREQEIGFLKALYGVKSKQQIVLKKQTTKCQQCLRCPVGGIIVIRKHISYVLESLDQINNQCSSTKDTFKRVQQNFTLLNADTLKETNNELTSQVDQDQKNVQQLCSSTDEVKPIIISSLIY